MSTDARVGSEYSPSEELASSVTHGVGALLAIAGLGVVVSTAAVHGQVRHIVSAAVYGATLVLLYLASTFYHAARRPRLKRTLRTLDHIGIYLLIAGTYTPFTLVTLEDGWGMALFAIIWTIAIVGSAIELWWTHRPAWTMVAAYVAMGWIIVVAMRQLVANLASPGLWLLIAGGLAYTLGTVFFLLKGVRYMHAVWHLWVMGGSACHFFAVLLYVMP